MSVATFTLESQTDDETEVIESSLCGMDLRFDLGNDTASVCNLVRYVMGQIQQLGLFDEGEAHRIGVALQEALLNAVHHGNLELSSELRQEDESLYHELANARRLMWPFCDRQVRVLASLSRDRVKFVIRDEGPGFDVHQVSDPTAKENLSRVGGRGLLLIRTFMDEVSHNEQGNCITLVKYTSAGHALLARLSSPDDLMVSPDVLLFECDGL